MKFLYKISFLIIAGIIFFTVANPIYKSIKELRVDINTYNIALQNSTELQNTRDALIQIYTSIGQEDKDRLEHFLPSAVNNIQLILEVEKIAGLHSMPIKDIKFEKKNVVSSKIDSSMIVAIEDPSENLPYGVFPIEFSVSGKYADFASFLGDLEYNLRILDIKSVEFTVPSSVPILASTANTGLTIDPDIYDYKLKADIYWLK